MALKIETFSSLKGGNSFFKAVTHPEAADKATALVARLAAAGAVSIYDPFGFLEGFAACRNLDGCRIEGVYVQAVAEIGKERLGCKARPVTELAGSKAALIFIAAFDADRLLQQIAHLLPEGAETVALDAMRLDEALLTNRRNYLDPLNFATNFAFFRDKDGQHTRLVTANYWSNYGAKDTSLALTLFDANGAVLARWHEALGPHNAAIAIDSRTVRQRFGLNAFEGQLFIHVIGAAGHDVVKYALDTFEGAGPSLSCTHDANAWPADFYAGLPAPRPDERVVLWVQNSLPIPIPAGALALNLMGDDRVVPFKDGVPPFATVPLDVASLLPDARWPQQIEIVAGRHLVRPRYEVIRGERRRIAHPNVERIDLKPNPELAALGTVMGKGFILPAPILPPDRWKSILLPTPMATTQSVLPITAVTYDPAGREIARKRFGRLARHESVALDLDELLGPARGLPFGHVELVYDWASGSEADGWLHALFRRVELRRPHLQYRADLSGRAAILCRATAGPFDAVVLAFGRGAARHALSFDLPGLDAVASQIHHRPYSHRPGRHGSGAAARRNRLWRLAILALRRDVRRFDAPKCRRRLFGGARCHLPVVRLPWPGRRGWPFQPGPHVWFLNSMFGF
jgi:hypothetical protein